MILNFIILAASYLLGCLIGVGILVAIATIIDKKGGEE